MPTSKAHQRAVNKYVKANYDRLNIVTAKGQKEVIQAAAASQGQSVNAYINQAIDERMESERNNSAITNSDSNAIETPAAHPPESQDEIEVPAFLLYRDSACLLCLMDDTDAGRVIKAASAYFLRGETPEASFHGIMKDAFKNIRNGIERDTAKYRRHAERNRAINRNRSNQRDAAQTP